jgi:hypothetical protein
LHVRRGKPDGRALTQSVVDATKATEATKWAVVNATTYADYIREDELPAPKVGRGMAGMLTNVTQLDRRKSDTA